jgi:hypothetical protein
VNRRRGSAELITTKHAVNLICFNLKVLHISAIACDNDAAAPCSLA